MVERRHNAGRERRRAAALDESDQRVQVHGAFVRQLLCQRRVEPGLAQPGAAPGDRVVRSSARRRLSAGLGMSSGSEIHASLARPRPVLLPTNSIFEEPLTRNLEVAEQVVRSIASGSEAGRGVDVDGAGNIHVTGQTASADHPTTGFSSYFGQGYQCIRGWITRRSQPL